MDVSGGDHPVIALRGNAVSSILGLNESGVWTSLAERPAAALDGAWDIVHTGSHLMLFTSDPTSHHLMFNTFDLSTDNGTTPGWMSVRFGDIIAQEPVHATMDSNGTVHMAYWDQTDDDVVLLRLYPDADRDLVFDIIDGMPAVGDQWMNSDGDAYGDNPLGPLPDACPTDAGLSSFVSQGCDCLLYTSPSPRDED